VEEVAVRLAERVKDLRRQVGLTQAGLAVRAGVTVETVARLERIVRARASANSNPSLETLARLSVALGVDVSELLSTRPPPLPQEDRLMHVLQNASAATRRRVLRVAEALIRDDMLAPAPANRRASRGR
jgi:transcriptional regulator with XRE-family HTH domain